MRFLLVLSICFCVANSSALGQQTDPRRSIAPALQSPANPQATPQTAPQQTAPQQTAPQQTAPQPDPGASSDFNDLEPAAPDDLSLDSSQSFDFDEPADTQYANTSDFQSSVASNSNFRGASPQMIGDFGGGSMILSIGGGSNSSLLTTPISLAGGSRRIKFAENNQVQPLNRIYGTFNYFDNAIVAGGPGAPDQSESISQGAFGIEKTFCDDYFSIDVRMPFTGGVRQTAVNNTSGLPPSSFALATGGVGNLSAGIKAYLLQTGKTSVSGGLAISMPTGSDVSIVVQQDFFGSLYEDEIEIDNDAVHLMPFLGVYRPFGDSWWLQAFTQVDTPAKGNDVRTNGEFVGRITEQTLLYADVSLGKWLYRNRCCCCRCRERGVTGIASVLELHYTGSLNDADTLETGYDTSSGLGLQKNRFDVLNLTLGLQVEICKLWRINAAGVVPLRERGFDDFGERQENRFFDGEFAIQINRFF